MRASDPHPLHEAATDVVDEPVEEHAPPAKSEKTARELRRRRRRLVRRALVAADLVGLALAFVAAQVLFPPERAWHGGLALTDELLLFAATLPAWVAVAKLYGLYDRDEERAAHSTLDELVGLFHLITVGTWLLFAAASVSGVAEPNLRKFGAFWVAAIALVAAGRSTARAYSRRQIGYLQNTVIVGAGRVGQLIARKFVLRPEYGIRLLGFVDADPPDELHADLEGIPLLGPPDRLPELVGELNVERVVVAFTRESDDRTLDLIRSLKYLDVQIDLAPRLFEIIGPNVAIHAVEGFPLIALPPARLSRSSRVVKRTMDVLVSGVALIVLAPVFALIALLIKLDSPGPVFFRQVRMGSGDRSFRIFKFRTMESWADERKNEFAHLNVHARSARGPHMFKIRDDPRVTRVGRVLRRYFLDELPQLVNVLKGEMSLVGPRPLILDEDQHVAEWARRRLDVKPGMTGLWQVLGRTSIPFEEMIKLDYVYVTTWSLRNDIRLLVRTVPLVLKGDTALY